MQQLAARLFSPRIWRDRLRRWHERWRGVDFSTVVRPEEVGLDPTRAVMSSPSGNKWVRRALDDLEISSADRVLDVGCGKGSAMKLLLDYPFARVDGVEASAQIAEVARANFEMLGTPRERYRVVAADAMTFTELDEYTYIYFYNPFSCDIMASFMANLEASLRRAPRKLTIVYDNPVCHQEIVAAGTFKKGAHDYPDAWGNRIYVYTNE